jgi:TupA-like ATPgrasp
MRRSLGYRPNLRHPQTYNEKIAWRILHDRNPLIVATTDKLAARDYVSSKVGPDLLVPIIGVYRNVADIPWAALPNQFVMKASHGCDMTLIVRDKDAIDRESTLERADGWLRQNYYELSREWAYREIPRRIIIEELLMDHGGRIPEDYKILVFHGRAAIIRVHIDRFGDHRVNYYDAQFRPLAIAQISPSAPRFTIPMEARSLTEIAERLAGDFDYARVDLYVARGKTWFGEITHHDGNAHVRFRPPEFDAALGAMWHLPIEAQDRAEQHRRSTIIAEANLQQFLVTA